MRRGALGRVQGQIALTVAVILMFGGANTNQSAAAEAKHEDASTQSFDALCGVNTLYVATRLLKGEVKFDDLLARFHTVGKEGVSMEDLYRVSQSLGLHARCVNIRGSAIPNRPDTVAIVLYYADRLKVGHYILARKIDENSVQMINPPSLPYTISSAALQNQPAHPTILISKSQMGLITVADSGTIVASGIRLPN